MKILATALSVIVLSLTFSPKADAGEWMGWHTYCAHHPVFAQHHHRLCH